MALISLHDVSVGYGGPPLIEGINLHIERGERVCLLGRNGTGKTTLMKLIDAQIAPESGDVVREQSIRTALLTQQVPQQTAGKVFDVVLEGLGKEGQLLAEYHRLSTRLAAGDHNLLGRLDKVQHQLDKSNAWQIDRQVELALSQMALDGNAEFGDLSAGLKRRVLLARAIANRPDLLMLDEPTNHLDIDAIAWIEEFMLAWGGTILFVTHDRHFIRKLSTRIAEVDRRRLILWDCDYDTYLNRKADALEAELKQQAAFDKKLASEEVWIRRGIQGRRTRDEGRVKALKKMRAEKQERLKMAGKVRMQAQDARLSGRLVIEAKDVSFGYDENTPIIRGLDTTILRGDKIGVIGPNGSGKTTLLRVLLRELKGQGEIRHGTKLQVGYFDQLHRQLDEEALVQDNVADGYKTLTINGQPRQVIGYLQDFLFTPDKAKQPVHRLSGGERNRLLLAKLFAKPSNVLVMDEPTNDLDIETLELLEELLMNYPGTVLLVSHDRAFLNNVVTSTIDLEGNGNVHEYAGGYDDYLVQRKTPEPEPPKKTPRPRQPKPETQQRKLTYKEKKELETLPDRIEQAEDELARLHEMMADGAFYKKGKDEIAETASRVETLETELTVMYNRWEELGDL